MKLWLKISLIAIIMTVIAASVCSLVLLVDAGGRELDTEVGNTLDTLELRSMAWQITFDTAADSGVKLDPISETSLAKFLMNSLADTKSALARDGKLLYNSTGINPMDYLTVEGENTQYIIVDIDGYSILVSGKQVNTTASGYVMYQMEDITYVYDDVRGIAYRFAGISLAVVGVVGLLTILLVRFLLRSVGKLQESATLIAGGVYDKRIEVQEQDEIGELADDFNKMADAVQEHITELNDEAERRTLLMSALTHELKTPLTSISGNAQTLLYTKLSEEEKSEALEMIDAECTRVERLSQKMMQLIVLRQTDATEMKDCDMAEFLDGVAKSCGTLLERSGVSLEMENHMESMRADADLMASLVINLIDNARKASGPGDVIKVTARDGAIEITDHGCGIPGEALPQVTQPFFMADKSRSRKVGGMGLGLALAEEIARLHGATLVFESEVGVGTTVKVVLEDA